MDPHDLDNDGTVSASERLSWWRRTWRSTPAPLRRSLIAVIGGTLVLLGLALVVLPGPFTLPLVIAGFAVLGTEFAWAHRVLEEGRRHAGRVVRRIHRR